MFDNNLIGFRTLSHMLQLHVLPEIQERIAAGRIRSNPMPFALESFQVIQARTHNEVQLNDEVGIVVRTKARRPIAAGSPVTLNDIYPDECTMQRPTRNGRDAAFFLCQSTFLNWSMIFDFEPNHPNYQPSALDHRVLQYPIADYVNATHLCERIAPTAKLEILTRSNWPPAPGYFPNVLIEMHENSLDPMSPSFVEVVSKAYNESYWSTRLAFWKETGFSPERLPYVAKAIEEFLEPDYISSIYVVVPQIEGILTDYLATSTINTNGGFRESVRKLGQLIKSRPAVMFPLRVLEQISEYLETGSFWARSVNIRDPRQEINRHGILHGLFTGFEEKSIALKYLILLDALAFLLLHEKILTGKL